MVLPFFVQNGKDFPMNNIQKCAIIGCGNVGATTAYALMKSNLFSEMVLIDVNRRKAEGEAADLNHGLPFNSPMNIYAGDYPDLEDASIVIITAGANQRPGQTRRDLVQKNTDIFQSIVENITACNQSCILLVVTNPVDILTYVTQKLSGFPTRRVLGSGTVLDTARLKYLVGRQLRVDYRNVHSFIIGEHGDSELPVWSGANVSGIDLDRFCESCDTCCDQEALDRLFHEVKNSAYHIIDAKGATYYAIAESVLKIVSAIVRDERTVLPVSAAVDGHYGLNDIVLSVPCIIGGNGVEEILDIPLSEEERELLYRSSDQLKEVIRGISLPALYALH